MRQEINDDRIAYLFGLGLSATVIATRMGLNTGTVRDRLMKRFGTSDPAKPYRPELVTHPELAGSHGFQRKAHFIEHLATGDGPNT